MGTNEYRKTQALLADEKNAVLYRPKWAKALGSITSAILLQQINYWWVSKGHKEFYKFRSECSHDLYCEGDSWIEELGFGDYEFDGALKSLATRVKAGDSKQSILDVTEPTFNEKGVMTNANCLVIYWISRGHVPYFELNEALFHNLVQALYEPVKANREKPDWEKANREKPVSQSGKTRLDIESGKTRLDRTETTRDYTETNTIEAQSAPPPEPIFKQPSLSDVSEATKAYAEICHIRPDETQRAAINRIVSNPDFFREVCQGWRLAGYNVKNLQGILEWYQEGKTSNGTLIPSTGKVTNISKQGTARAGANAFIQRQLNKQQAG